MCESPAHFKRSWFILKSEESKNLHIWGKQLTPLNYFILTGSFYNGQKRARK